MAHTPINMKQYQKQTIKSILILLGVGMFYAFITTVTPFRIPCVFYEMTGLYCPGCGMTRMCLALLRLDFVSAFHANPLACLTLPIWGSILLYTIYRYFRYGTMKYEGKLGKLIQIVLIVLVVLFVLFGILRNFPGMQSLQPME